MGDWLAALLAVNLLFNLLLLLKVHFCGGDSSGPVFPEFSVLCGV